MGLHIDLMELIRCPKCRGALDLRDDGLACRACQLLYPIIDDVPQLLTEEAKQIGG